MTSNTDGVFRAVCRPNCFGYCPHDVTVRGGRIVKSTFAELPDPKWNRICLRGLTNLQRVYDDDRISYPMRRVGPRGSGEWEQISWDEAITMIVDNWRETQQRYGDQAVAVFGGSGNSGMLHGTTPGLMSRLRNMIGATYVHSSVDLGITAGVQSVIGNAGTWPGNGIDQIVHAKTIIVDGANVTEATIHNWHFVCAAKEAGAKLVVIDPVFTKIAAQADQYISCRPGSDPALMMAIMHVIVRDGQHNVEFLTTKTVAPYLVRDDDGHYLRMHDLGHVGDDRVLVRSLGGEVGPFDEVPDPVIDGRFDIDGHAVATAFQLLRERLVEYPPEQVSEVTEIPAATIEELAGYFTSGPTTLLAGYGSQSFNNGSMVGRTYMTLAAITGNIGKPGCDIGVHWEIFRGINWGFATPTGRLSPSVELVNLPDIMTTDSFDGKPFPIRSFYIYAGNPVGNATDQNRFLREVIEPMDFVCTVDLAMSDTVRHSDLVLPAAHFYEVSDIPGAIGCHPYLQFSNQVVAPRHGAKPDGDIARLLAAELGLGEYFNGTDDEYFAELLDTDYAREYGISYDKLRAEGAIRAVPDPWVAFGGDQSFPTPDGRMHFYNEQPRPRVRYGQELPVDRERLPGFFPPTEAWPTTDAFKKYPLVLLSERSRFRVHSQWFGVPWLREIDPEPIIKINTKDARARGIEQNDLVEVYNDRGRVVARAQVTEGIRPGVLTYPKGWQRHQHRAGSFSELNSMVVDPIGVNQSFFDATCEIRPWTED